MKDNTGKTIAVVAGALIDADGRYMLGSRPEGKPYAGYWEFPGGKVEPGETLFAALAREFDEEMGVRVEHATPWLTRVHHYEHASVHLTFFRVWSWAGTPRPHEGQSFAWQKPGEERVAPMLPANGPILRALSLPLSLRVGVDGGFAIGNEAGVLLALNDWQRSGRPDAPWAGACVGSAAELSEAARLGFDFAVADAAGEWDTFDRVVNDGWPLPVYAAGAALAVALEHGAHGVLEADA
ncbi:NUDIX domain-containing protein [Crenobacter caeni]|uniref:8-oxo-dGTP diphosphatase n=1 Tax=Crenobacter caeni TaxID=2705474 RepID=A0A6B2KVF9_9NEIS|nr:NUDIX domain-containing protein [Crenobacter caeni]NDV14245.1 NUDIX domain-containing protein [Crenobacter caeni]